MKSNPSHKASSTIWDLISWYSTSTLLLELLGWTGSEFDILSDPSLLSVQTGEISIKFSVWQVSLAHQRLEAASQTSPGSKSRIKEWEEKSGGTDLFYQVLKEILDWIGLGPVLCDAKMQILTWNERNETYRCNVCAFKLVVMLKIECLNLANNTISHGERIH